MPRLPVLGRREVGCFSCERVHAQLLKCILFRVDSTFNCFLPPAAITCEVLRFAPIFIPEDALCRFGSVVLACPFLNHIRIVSNLHFNTQPLLFLLSHLLLSLFVSHHTTLTPLRSCLPSTAQRQTFFVAFSSQHFQAVIPPVCAIIWGDAIALSFVAC